MLDHYAARSTDQMIKMRPMANVEATTCGDSCDDHSSDLGEEVVVEGSACEGRHLVDWTEGRPGGRMKLLEIRAPTGQAVCKGKKQIKSRRS